VSSTGLADGPCQKRKDRQDSTRFTKIKRHTNDLDSADEVNPRRFERVGQLHALAADAGIPVAHLAIPFVLEHPVASSVITGPGTMEQLQDSIAVAGLWLDDDLLDALNKLVEPGEDLYRMLPVAAQPPSCLAASYRRRSRRGVTQ
jgi:aryl-alcohol dehydrogenase-like predicted oxidoreductase